MHIQTINTQVLVLGSGPGGYSAAFRCADLGINTILIERYSNLGGICLNVGCIPSKTLLYIAKLIKTQQNLKKYGIFSGETHIDIDKIRSRKNEIVTQLSHHLKFMAKKRNIQIINGSGKFLDSHTIQIKNHQKISKITFQYAIIAAGSHSISLPLLATNNDPRIWNSTDALTLKSIPKKLLIIGSGAIGLEMATIYHALGTKIDIVEIHNHIIPILDKDIVDAFTKIISKNINLIVNTQINSIESKQDGIYVSMENKKQNLTNIQRYDTVLVAIGRAPNGNTLDVVQAGVNIDANGFIPVNAQMRTNIKHIFAIGDIVGHPMLAHKSIYEGHIAAEVISGKKRYFDSKIIPSIIYTDPEIAWVGYSEKDARNKNIDYEVSIFPWSASGRAITSDCTNGMTKLIFNKKTHRIIGSTILGAHAGEILGEISLAIEMGCDVEDIALTIHAHPTLCESIAQAASIYKGSITDLINIKNKQ